MVVVAPLPRTLAQSDQVVSPSVLLAVSVGSILSATALVWQRAVSVEDDGALTSDLPDFQVELRDRTGAMVGRSDDPANNVEHIYLPGSLTIGQSYTITVSLKTPAAPTHYGLAWQSCTDALKESLRR